MGSVGGDEMTKPELIQHYEHDLKTKKLPMWEKQIMNQTIYFLKKTESRYCPNCGEKL